MFICLYNELKHKKTKDMRRKPLTPELSEKKKNLQEMAKNISILKKKITDFQKELSFAKSTERKDSIKEHLKTFISRRNTVSHLYRHMHIAYSELRGTSREEIEKNTPRAKPIEEKLIADFKK